MDVSASLTLPPLLGCLYCHAEGATTLVEPRRLWIFGSPYPLIKCSECGAVAQLDLISDDADRWQIRYRSVRRDPRFYYVQQHLGRAGWLTDYEALEISTQGYAQRQRVQQAKRGELEWLQPRRLNPPPPLMAPDETVYLTLKAVTYQNAPPVGFLVRADQGDVLDSGKLYITDQKLHLLGQRRDWSQRLSDIEDVQYDSEAWRVVLNVGSQLQQYRGVNVTGQWDAQLVGTVINALRYRA